MRYHFEGDVRPEFAAMDDDEAVAKFLELFATRRRSPFAVFETLCELLVVIETKQAVEGDFDFSPAIAERNARPMEDLRKLYPAASDETV